MRVTIGERIREARTHKGWTQHQLAMALGFRSRGTLVGWENERSQPTINNLLSLCRALDVSADHLLGLDR